ncbi:MAG: adenylate/guanylate cyclase domain-containing protein [Dehalococcoidia bacterium]|nr:MAG: adenylate/guanylate cyclase domain-containing protein [Dehalococcoidia bacterium]
MEAQIRFCTSADGTRIGYATLGEGPPLVSVAPWGGDVGRYWGNPDCRPALESLSRGRLFAIFDRRGVGASQREVDAFSLEAQVADLAAVADHLGLERFDLWGMLEGAAISVAYAVEHPERVSRLALWSPYPCGVEITRPGAVRVLVELIRGNWGLARRAIADVTFPSGPTELQRWFSDSLREHASPEVTAKCIEFYATVDVRPLLPRVKAPTLVLHRRGNRDAPTSAAMAVAALVPDARFVALEGDMDYPLLGDISYLETLTQFLDEGRSEGRTAKPSAASSLVTILFTDMEGSTSLTQRLGDAKAQEVVRTHNRIVRDALKAHSGSEIKHTGDGIMASFASASRALECAIAIQRTLAQHNESNPDMPIGVRIGLNAGEPVAEEEDLFGTAVQLAARICAHAEPGEILAPIVVRELAAGKGFLLADRGDVALRGFEDPVRLYEVRWREEG